jgi:hypothetical protein
MEAARRNNCRYKEVESWLFTDRFYSRLGRQKPENGLGLSRRLSVAAQVIVEVGGTSSQSLVDG